MPLPVFVASRDSPFQYPFFNALAAATSHSSCASIPATSNALRWRPMHADHPRCPVRDLVGDLPTFLRGDSAGSWHVGLWFRSLYRRRHGCTRAPEAMD